MGQTSIVLCALLFGGKIPSV